MKDLPRMALLAAILAVVFLLLQQWRIFDAKLSTAAAISTTAGNSTNASATSTASNTLPANTSAAINDLPNEAPAPGVPAPVAVTAAVVDTTITVDTDVLSVRIDRRGGDIVRVTLPTYPADLDRPDIPFELLAQRNDKTYVAQSGLFGKNGIDKNASERPLFDAAQTEYRLADGAQTLQVDLVLPEQDGIQITKQFVFHRGEHLIDVHYRVNNQSAAPWEAALFGQIKRDTSVPKTSATGLKPFLGGATSTDESHYKKLNFKDINKAAFNEVHSGGWIAFVQHYFISAWVPAAADRNTFSMGQVGESGLYYFRFTSPTKTIAAGQQGELSAQFYAGPKTTSRLEQISPYLDLTVDYGWLWWVAKPIHALLKWIHVVIHNWGWSIVGLTVMIKLILFPLSHKAYISMGHMRKVAPKMNAIREQCGDNRQKLQEEMLKLYRTEKINPMGGCLPMLLQMPVFLALYWVLMESVELRQAPFVGWIHDLSVMDPYFVLPILMGISMFLQQKMNPAPPDPMQAKVMQFLPIVFTFMFLWFPAGLVLYWLVNNITSMAHQAYINKLVDRGAA